MDTILDDFPIVDFAFAYGSAVFGQNGYSELEKKNALIDVIFCVKDVEQWHSANITLNAHHYSFLRYFSYDFIGKVQVKYRLSSRILVLDFILCPMYK